MGKGRKAGIVNAVLGLDISKFSTNLQNAQRSLKKSGQQFQKFGKSMTRSLTMPLGIAGGLAVKTFADFEQSMAKVQAISGATSKEFEQLKENALELGRTTRYTASEVAELQLNLSKLGLSTAEITASTDSILALSLATGEDLAESATVAAGVMRAFGLQAEDMGRVTDVMASSFSNSALDLEKFKVAMSTAAPVARKAGADLERTTAIMGVLTNNSIDASTAGTALRNIFLDLAASGMTWNEAMNAIRSSSNPLNTALEMFGKRGTTVATVIAENAEQISKLNKTFDMSAGEAKRMAAMMDNTLNGAFLRMKSAVEGVAIDLGGIMKPAIEKMTIIITAFADSFSKLDDSTKKTVIGIAAITAAIGPLMMGIGAAIKAIPLIGKGFAFLTSPIGLVIVALATLTSAFVAYKMSGMNAIDYVAYKWKQSVNTSIKAIQTYLRAIGALTGALDIFIAAITGRKVSRNIFLDAAVGLERLTYDLPKPKSKMDDFMESIKKAKEEADRLVESLNKVVDFEGSDEPESQPKATGKPNNGMLGFISALSGTPKQVAPVVDYLSDLRDHLGEVEYKAQMAKAAWMKFADGVKKTAKSMIVPALESIGYELGRALGQGGFKNGELGKALIDQIMQFASMLGDQLIVIGSALMLAPGMQGAGQGYITAGALLKVGAAIGRGYVQGAMGGATMQGTAMSDAGAPVTVTGVIRGADLHLMVGDQNRRRR